MYRMPARPAGGASAFQGWGGQSNAALRYQWVGLSRLRRSSEDVARADYSAGAAGTTQPDWTLAALS